jgi:hypothetical protein
VAGELQIRIDPRFGTVTLPHDRGDMVLSRFADLLAPRSILIVSRAHSRAPPRSVSCSAAVTSSSRMRYGGS